jgi:hypothetical protein
MKTGSTARKELLGREQQMRRYLDGAARQTIEHAIPTQGSVASRILAVRASIPWHVKRRNGVMCSRDVVCGALGKCG